MDTAIPNDLSAFWMPFSANRQFKAAPRLLVSAKDMHYRTHDGREILGGTAGLWCVDPVHGTDKAVRECRFVDQPSKGLMSVDVAGDP